MQFNFSALTSHLHLIGLESVKPRTLFQRQAQVFSVHKNSIHFSCFFSINDSLLGISNSKQMWGHMCSF